MIAYIYENLATIIGSVIVFSVFFLIIIKQVKNKKAHKGGCGGGCGSCPSSSICHSQNKP